MILPSGRKRCPDFTIVDSATGINYYWEHLGLLDDPGYRARWEIKREEVYSLSSGTDIVWTPIISVVIPLLAGMIIGNLDHEFRDFCLPAIGIIMPFFGWVLGDSINLFQAARAGLAGVILSVVFYIVLLPTLYFTETKLLKANGISAIALTSVAGVSLAAPSVIAQAYPELEPILPLVVSQIAMAVVITSVLTPMIANKIAKKKNLVKH